MVNTSLLIECIGYLGSIIVVLSMFMTTVKGLRIVNVTGSVLCLIYSLIVHTYPVTLMNACLILINVYQLIRLRRRERRIKEREASKEAVAKGD